jgi:WD40 repeat protein
VVDSDGRLVSSGADGVIRVWRIPRPQSSSSAAAAAPVALSAECVLKGHSKNVMALAAYYGHMTGAGGGSAPRLLSGSHDKSVRCWELPTAKATGAAASAAKSLWTEAKAHSGAVTAIHTLPDGRFVTASDDTSLQLWTALSSGGGFRAVHRFVGHTKPVRCLTALPDGRIVSGARDTTVRLWTVPPLQSESASGRPAESQCDDLLDGHEFPVQCLLAIP